MYILENKYNRLFKKPKVEAGSLPITLEYISEQIVALGLLRISDDSICNFVNLPLLNGKKNFSFSKREVFDEALLKKTYQIISENLTIEERKNEQASINNKIEYLKSQILKYTQVPEGYEIKLARIIAQSAHPAILFNILQDGVKIFVSFSHSISDLLDIQNWQKSRSNSGMQSTGYEEVAIYISCAGNPFLTPEKNAENSEYQSDYSGDGFAALARMMIVAAQEIGHYADIKKQPIYGERFSLNVRNNYANDDCNKARNLDLENILKIKAKLKKAGIEKLFELEKRVEVQAKYRKFSISLLFLRFYKMIFASIFKTICDAKGLYFYRHIKNHKILAAEIAECVADYQFNLAPKADVYRNQNPNIEQGIACAEALARVPQQEIKWGVDINKFFIPKMHNFYYKNLVPASINYYEKSTGKKFYINNKMPYVPIYKKILNAIKSLE
jgi:hypothetical protein